MKIAVDMTGGDHSPSAPIQAVVQAARELPEVEFLIVGPEPAMTNLLEQHGGRGLGIHVIDAPDVIGPDESPAQAVRRKPHSSINVGINLVRAGTADAFLSAGNTGALMVAGTLQLGMLPGVRRPALAAMLPTRDGRGFLLLDLGAQVDCNAEHLVQFAVMGSVYLERVLGVESPRVALLSLGTEPAKGNRAVREAHEALLNSALQFVGNVEARDLFDRVADVVVCDGFVGNAVLKTIEGTAFGLFRLLRAEVNRNFLSSVGAWLARDALLRVRARLDYTEYGGAPLLGLAGVVVKSHGSSNVRALRNGITVAVQAVKEQVISRTAEGIAAAGRTLQ